jgi:hypothetical protein
MTSRAVSSQALAIEKRDRQVPQWRLHVLRAVALFFCHQWLLQHSTDAD